MHKATDPQNFHPPVVLSVIYIILFVIGSAFNFDLAKGAFLVGNQSENAGFGLMSLIALALTGLGLLGLGLSLKIYRKSREVKVAKLAPQFIFLALLLFPVATGAYFRISMILWSIVNGR
jgi:hypothetical protein